MPTTTPRADGALHELLVATLARLRARLHDLRAALGVVVLGGAVVVAASVVVFAWLAHRVVAGRTQPFDEAVLRTLGAHHTAWVEAVMLEVTFLGTATVVLTLAGVAALFLALTRQRTAAALLVWATLGAVLLNNLLKALFRRDRPHVFEWGTHAATTSFPSGHAMSAAAVYGTVAFLAARLARRRATRVAIHAGAVTLVLLIAFSRLYLGVHYPTDVAAGLVLGAGWAAFCAAALEAGQHLARRTRRRRGSDGGGDVPEADAPLPGGP